MSAAAEQGKAPQGACAQTRYRDQVVVVTGAASGIGRALARGFAAEGARVAILDVNRSGAEETLTQCPESRAYLCDVANVRDVQASFLAIDEELGPCDVLVNNAGVAPVDPAVNERQAEDFRAALRGEERLSLQATSTLSDERWDRTLKIHLYGTFHCTREALRRMEPRRRGAILNIASTSALRGQAPTPDYSAAKGGIVSFTKSVALEVIRRRDPRQRSRPRLDRDADERELRRERAPLPARPDPPGPVRDARRGHSVRAASLLAGGELHGRPDHQPERRALHVSFGVRGDPTLS